MSELGRLHGINETPEQPELTAAELKQKLSDQLWRLNNLYFITDKNGKRVKFQMNWAQEELYREMWYLNNILKARQLGFTTFIDLFGLDCCVFNENYKFGIVADTRDNANAIFEEKIQYPYENLPESIRATVTAKTDRVGELRFSNNSLIRVGTSLRSGTYQMLHVSEYGKISVTHPKKAKEIKTGSFETVGQGNMIFVESTAEGKGGEFYELCQTSQKMKEARTPLTSMDFKFFFYPWWRNPGYSLDYRHVVIPSRLLKYFAELEKEHGIELSRRQKAWYAKKEATQGEDMKKEYPSTPEEAFDTSVKGAYFAKQIREARQLGRITAVPFVPGYPVDTWWDLGVNDMNAIWFTQTVGRQVRCIYYHEDSGESFAHYSRVLKELANDRQWRYGTHNGPHDLSVREIGQESFEGGAKSRIESARDHGIVFEIVPRVEHKPDGIEACREFIPHCVFDEEGCELGIKRLENHRKEWDDIRGVYKNTPFRGPDKHGADAFETLARGHGLNRKRPRPVPQKQVSPRGWT